MPIKEGWRVSAGIMGVIGVCHVVTMSYLSYSSTRHNATGKYMVISIQPRNTSGLRALPT